MGTVKDALSPDQGAAKMAGVIPKQGWPMNATDQAVADWPVAVSDKGSQNSGLNLEPHFHPARGRAAER